MNWISEVGTLLARELIHDDLRRLEMGAVVSLVTAETGSFNPHCRGKRGTTTASSVALNKNKK
jgi:hypothetical protein